MTTQLRLRADLPLMCAGLLVALSACTPEAIYNRSLEQVTVVSYHRLYPAFAETTQVAPGELFAVGEGEYAARVTQFLPEFQMDDQGHASSHSDRVLNPAVRLEVLRGRSRQAFAWAFMRTGPPHFRAGDEFAFALKSLRLRNGQEINSEVLSQP